MASELTDRIVSSRWHTEVWIAAIVWHVHAVSEVGVKELVVVTDIISLSTNNKPVAVLEHLNFGPRT
jgi:hypothetical protein